MTFAVCSEKASAHVMLQKHPLNDARLCLSDQLPAAAEGLGLTHLLHLSLQLGLQYARY